MQDAYDTCPIALMMTSVVTCDHTPVQVSVGPATQHERCRSRTCHSGSSLKQDSPPSWHMRVWKVEHTLKPAMLLKLRPQQYSYTAAMLHAHGKFPLTPIIMQASKWGGCGHSHIHNDRRRLTIRSLRQTYLPATSVPESASLLRDSKTLAAGDPTDPSSC